jgi:hypothetical protein
MRQWRRRRRTATILAARLANNNQQMSHKYRANVNRITFGYFYDSIDSVPDVRLSLCLLQADYCSTFTSVTTTADSPEAIVYDCMGTKTDTPVELVSINIVCEENGK